MATSLLSPRVIVVCQTEERLPTCSGTLSANSGSPPLAAPMKLALLSMVVVFAPSGRFSHAPQDATMSARDMITPPCRALPERHSSLRDASVARRRVGVASVNSRPIILGKGCSAGGGGGGAAGARA